MSNSDSSQDAQCAACCRDIFDLDYTCARCKKIYHAACIDLENVPRRRVRPDYICASCIRSRESNVESPHIVPESLPPATIKEIVEIALDGLFQDGSHHKQWYLERIIEKILGKNDAAHLESNSIIEGFVWEKGIAP